MGISVNEILERAKKGIFVSKYSYSHESLRKKTRRMCKDGLLKMKDQNKDGFFYVLAERNNEQDSTESD